MVNYMIVRVTADHVPGNDGIKEVAFNYNSLSKPFFKNIYIKREIDGVNPVVISQLNETFWFSRYQIYDTLRYLINESFITFCLFNKLFPVTPKLLIDSPSAFKLGRFSKDNITLSENAKNVRKWLNALNFPLCHWSVRFLDLFAPPRQCRHAVFASCLLVLIFCFLDFFKRSLTGKRMAWKKTWICHSHISHNKPCLPPKMLDKNCLQST